MPWVPFSLRSLRDNGCYIWAWRFIYIFLLRDRFGSESWASCVTTTTGTTGTYRYRSPHGGESGLARGNGRCTSLCSYFSGHIDWTTLGLRIFGTGEHADVMYH